MGIFDVGRNHSLSGPGISARGAPVGHAGDLDSARLRPFGAIASTQNRGRGRVFIFMRSIDVVINGDFLGPPVTALGAFVRTPRWFCYSGLGRIALSLLIGLLFFIELLGFRLVQRDGLGAGMDVVVDFVDVVLRAPLPRPTAPACCALVGPAGQFLVAPLGAFDSFGQFWGEAYAMLCPALFLQRASTLVISFLYSPRIPTLRIHRVVVVASLLSSPRIPTLCIHCVGVCVAEAGKRQTNNKYQSLLNTKNGRRP